MNGKKRRCLLLLVAALAMTLAGACAKVGGPTISETTQDDLQKRARSSLDSLYASSMQAKELQKRSIATLVFPSVFRAGLIVGGSGGNGVLFSPDGTVLGYYNLASLTFGLQAGAQDYSLAMFLISHDALDYLNRSDGWAIGFGPTIVVVTEGAGQDVTTTTARSDVYAFIYGQEGLMGGLGLQGQKITRLRPAAP